MTETRKLAKEAGIEFRVYYNVGLDNYMAEARPDWACVEADGATGKRFTGTARSIPQTHVIAVVAGRRIASGLGMSLLIRQINERLSSKLDENVTKQEFDGIFKKPSLGQIETGPSFEQIVESVTVKVLGPPDAIEVFSDVCRSHGLPASIVDTGERCSTGVRMVVDVPSIEDEEKEFIRKENEKTREKNAKTLAEPRDCEFVLSPINISLPISTVDHWLENVGIRKPIVVKVKLLYGIECENRAEAISAKIHESQLSLREDGTLLWAERIILTLCSRGDQTLTLNAPDVSVMSLSNFHLKDLVGTLFGLNILSVPAQRGMRRKR